MTHKLDFQAIPDSWGKLILTDLSPAYNYVDNVRQDTATGKRLKIVLPNMGYKTLSVTISDAHPPITEAELENPDPVYITLTNAIIYPYVSKTGNLDYSIKADSFVIDAGKSSILTPAPIVSSKGGVGNA